MQLMNLQHILAMGGYGIYVWPAYGITFLTLFINLVVTRREKKRVKKSLQLFHSQS